MKKKEIGIYRYPLTKRLRDLAEQPGVMYEKGTLHKKEAL